MKASTATILPYVIAEKISRFELIASLGMDPAEFGALNPHLQEFDVFAEGVPLNIPEASIGQLPAAKSRPVEEKGHLKALDWAIEEFRKRVHEYAGPISSNPQIAAYQQSASGVAPDDVPWCSSFVNWCVVKAGLEGTNNNAARSWHQWGTERQIPVQGDVAVFQRKDLCWKGHVGFFWNDAGSYLNLLCGNHQNDVGIFAFPKNGSVYQLLSIRTVD
ncbi:TIGR02594 family protein [Roseibium sp.]|uniref:TIGR02594 family protein n=1 Tax=Roseibium sp. TaxID=1936156 RepID=UPI003A981306